MRDEHRQAHEWLNERTDSAAMLFAIELEVLQIDQSPAAHNFKLVVFPNKWQKSTCTGAAVPAAPRAEAYRSFFQQLIDELRTKHKFTGARAAFPQNWFGFATGMSGVTYSASFAQGNRARVELDIDRGELEENKRLFDWLASRRAELESALGHSLEWERPDNRRSCRIAIYRQGSIASDDITLTEIKSWFISELLKFKQVSGPMLKAYPRNVAT